MGAPGSAPTVASVEEGPRWSKGAHDCAAAEEGGHHGHMAAAPEPTLALAQAQARWGGEVAVAGLFRPGPDSDARTALTKAVSRRTNRRRSHLPGRVLIAIDSDGRAFVCPYLPDPQGGHPEGGDLYAGPFEELGAVPTGPLAMVVLLDATWAVVLEAVWLDRDAATVAALLTGEPVPDEPDLLPEPASAGDDGDDGPSAFAETLMIQAEAAQSRADALRTLALAARAEEAEEAAPTMAPEPATTSSVVETEGRDDGHQNGTV